MGQRDPYADLDPDFRPIAQAIDETVTYATAPWSELRVVAPARRTRQRRSSTPLLDRAERMTQLLSMLIEKEDRDV
jgi:hypothetical protein